MIDLARWYLGEISCVCRPHWRILLTGRARTSRRPRPPTTRRCCCRSSASGAQATVQVSGGANVLHKEGWAARSQLYGETGSLDVSLTVNDAIGWVQAGTPGIQQLAVPSELGVTQLRRFLQGPGRPAPVDSTRSPGLPVEPNFYDGLRAQEVVDAAVSSRTAAVGRSRLAKQEHSIWASTDYRDHCQRVTIPSSGDHLHNGGGLGGFAAPELRVRAVRHSRQRDTNDKCSSEFLV